MKYQYDVFKIQAILKICNRYVTNGRWPSPLHVTKRNKIRDPLPPLRCYVVFEWSQSVYVEASKSFQRGISHHGKVCEGHMNVNTKSDIAHSHLLYSALRRITYLRVPRSTEAKTTSVFFSSLYAVHRALNITFSRIHKITKIRNYSHPWLVIPVISSFPKKT